MFRRAPSTRRALWFRSLCGVAALAACDPSGSSVPVRDGQPVEPDIGPSDASTPGPEAGRLDATQPDAAPRPADGGGPHRDAGPEPDAGAPLPDPIRLNEVQSRNGGTWVDEQGALEDWIELVNAGAETVDLAGYALGDDEDPDTTLPSDPALRVPPGGVVVLFADGAPGEGPAHVDFKLSGSGESLRLWSPAGTLIDEVELPPMGENESFARRPDGRGAFEVCGWATPGRSNGPTCGPPPPPALPDDETFTPYAWPDPWPTPPHPLSLDELALYPDEAGGEPPFIEVHNATDAPVPLDGWRLVLAAHGPGRPPPGPDDGEVRSLGEPGEVLAPGDRSVLALDAAQRALLDANGGEFIVALYGPGEGFATDRVDGMAFPAGASLARRPDATGRHVFCRVPTPGAPNDACDPLPERPIGDRVRHLRTPGDFPRLARGGTSVGVEQVKWLLDMAAGDTLYFLDTARWDLHYTFVREAILGQPHLDRCDPQENALFYDGWLAFSEVNYFRSEGRRFLMGTLVHHAGADLYTVEYAAGDALTSEQMRRGFLAVMAHVDDHRRYALRAADAGQVERVRALDGRLPIVGINAPYRGVTYQPLTEAVGYGVLTFVPADALEQAPLGEQVIVVTDRVPNDIPLVGGLITEAFQTPLAHVNLLSRNRGTPNMALRNAREDARIAPHLDTLVRLTVAPGAFDVTPVPPEEALAFWASRRPTGDPVRPRIDTSLRGVVPLRERAFADLPALGGKAAQFAELYRVVSRDPDCAGPLFVPPDAAAIPVVHGLEHFEASGAAARLAALSADPAFHADPAVRDAGLAEVRSLIAAHPVDPVLLDEVEAYVATHFGAGKARFRSSSNTEDLPGFNGAGLYTSTSADGADPEATVADALRTVWASLWNRRGYDERAYHNVAQDAVAMGVLLHPAYPTERANGVAISRNILEPLYRDHYINAQIGEASVTNPAPGVTSDQLVFHRRSPPTIEYLGRSSLTGGRPVLTDGELADLSCRLAAIHGHYQPLLDPDGTQRWFAMDTEFKLLGDERALLFKQARAYAFGDVDIPADCREF
ncbi:lamin tail domain-containing protein [Myxococcota bacterium]|nr:lamin tail domain-containing protein [Myxococcota bacterium]